ncbi:MAG: Hpt domain-containing protein, partial [Rhodocyclaceae bacterium]|nr:Hpt domain-containing protein [Rhodocyclaceae bacterium]
MSDFAGMEDLLLDFLTEATDLLSDVDNKLVDLEKNPQDARLLNDIFRGFHTIKGGAGFLNAAELVTLCHLTENLFDKLRTGELILTKEIMDSIMAATGTVRDMFGHLDSGVLPPPADAHLIANLKAALAGEPVVAAVPAAVATSVAAPVAAAALTAGPDWTQLHGAVAGAAAVSSHDGVAVAPTSVAETGMHTQVADQTPEVIIQHAVGRRATDKPGAAAVSVPAGRRDSEKGR